VPDSCQTPMFDAVNGQVIAGCTGTQERATCTCIGDTVSVAACMDALQFKGEAVAVEVHAVLQAAVQAG
jgi:class 3 adenylate cyclase